MPALPAVPKTIRLQFFSSDDADLNVLNTLHYQYAGSSSQTDLDTFTEAAENAWETNILPQMASNVHLVKVVSTDLNTSSSPQSTVISGAPGSGSGAAVSAGAAMVISFKIARRFRGGHTRIYLAGIVASALQTAQTWQSTVLANVTTAFLNFDTAIEAYGGATMGAVDQVAVSFYSGFTVVTNPITHRARNVPALRAGGPLVELTATGYPNAKVASQRRRNLQSA
jgi:hypothetical protein